MNELRKKISKKKIKTEELRIFEHGKFVFAAFDEGGEMVVDLATKPLEDLMAFLKRMVPID